MAILGRNNYVFTSNSAMRRALQNTENASRISSVNSLSPDAVSENIKKANNSFDSFQYLAENIGDSKMSVALKHMMESING